MGDNIQPMKASYQSVEKAYFVDVSKTSKSQKATYMALKLCCIKSN